MSDWQTFLKESLPRLGAEVDWDGPRLQMISPPPLGSGDIQEFWTGEAHQCPPDLTPIYPGHPLLETVQTSLSSSGRLRARHMPAPRTRKSDLAGQAKKAFALRNADLVVESIAPQVTPWIFFHFRVVYQWDERRVELRTVGVDSLSGICLEADCLDKVWLEPGPGTGQRDQLAASYAKAQTFLQHRIAPRLESLQREARRFQDAERSRLERYYHTILTDLQKRQGSEEKRARAEQEREVRRRELEEKVRLRVSAELVQVDLVDLPREHLKVLIKQRKRELPLVLSYNPARHDFDPVACHHCLKNTRVLWMCDQKHLLCDSCYGLCRDCRTPQCSCCLGQLKAAVCSDCQKKPPKVESTPTPTPRRAEKQSTPKRSETNLFTRIFADFTDRFADLPAFLEPLEQPLRNNDFARCEKLLREFHRDLDPVKAAPVRDRLKDCLEAFKAGRGDKIRQKLESLGPPRRDLNWLLDPLKKYFRADQLGVIEQGVQRQLVDLQSRVPEWHWQWQAVALVYLNTSMTQKEVASCFRVSSAKLGQCARDIKEVCPPQSKVR